MLINLLKTKSFKIEQLMVLLGLLTFFSIFSLSAYFTNPPPGKDYIDVLAMSAIIASMNTYISLFIAPIPWRRLSISNNIALKIFASLAFNLIIISIASAISLWLELQIGNRNSYFSIFYYYILYGIPFLTCIGYFLDLLEFIEQKKMIIKKELEIAQTTLLNNQTNPNAALNTLNFIDNLIHEASPILQSTAAAMAEYLRRVLDATNHYEYMLTEERILMENFLEFEVKRFSNNLKIKWEWDESLNSFKLPPLLLQPMVENAIRHGIEPNDGGSLNIIAERSCNGIRLAIQNTVSQSRAKSIKLHGIGVKNLKSRLRITYGEKARYNFNIAEGWAIAEIIINCDLEKSILHWKW